MFKSLRKYFFRQKIKRLIKLASVAIYSEQFDMEILVNNISSSDDGVDLLRAYVAIQTATRLNVPICEKDIDHALDELHSSEQHINEPDFETILGLHKDLAEIYWLKKTETILEAKLSYKTDEYSYEGMLYRLENDMKGPATNQEREKYRKLSKAIHEADGKLEEYLDENASKEAAEEAFKKLKYEVESEIREHGPSTKEDLQKELDDLISQLKISLKPKKDNDL